MSALIICKHKGKQNCVNRKGDKCDALSNCDFYDYKGKPKECPFYKKEESISNINKGEKNNVDSYK